jgi:hypothetical protein
MRQAPASGERPNVNSLSATTIRTPSAIEGVDFSAAYVGL